VDRIIYQINDRETLSLLESNMGLMWLAMGEYEIFAQHPAMEELQLAETLTQP
jgi:hypothetical protein